MERGFCYSCGDIVKVEYKTAKSYVCLVCGTLLKVMKDSVLIKTAPPKGKKKAGHGH